MIFNEAEMATLACAVKCLISELSNESLDYFVDGDNRVLQNETQLMQLEAKLTHCLTSTNTEISCTEEKYECIGISTAHLTDKDLLQLDVLADDDDCNMIMKRSTGWFIKLYPEAEANLTYASMSNDFHHILQEAHKAGFRLVEFDSDASQYDCFVLNN